MPKKDLLLIIVIVIGLVIIGRVFKKQDDEIKFNETTRVVKAEFSESVENPGTTCISLEGSKRSFFNSKKYDKSTIFELVEAEVNGEVCVRRVLANKEDLIDPSEPAKPCLNYKYPETFCKGFRHCMKVRDHCF